jgi:transcriptional regulator with XRE-family HTH domain
MNKLGEYLANARRRAKLTLRAAENATGISNAYLSQLENGKIQQPSPILLEKIAGPYQVDYSTLLELSGYPIPHQHQRSVSRLEARFGPTTREEEEALIDYLNFLRTKRKSGGGLSK